MNCFEPETLEAITRLLNTGEVEVVGQVTWGSNFTFLVKIEGEDGEIPAIYKPARGEQPLWDFPHGSLAHREVAAFLTSQALGWELVPPTVLRTDAPAGPGSMQLYIDVNPERHYFTFSEMEKQRLRPTALLDVIINNADRKSGHILLSEDDRLWLIDHGLCFHDEEKLRTVVWDFAGEAVPGELLASVRCLRGKLEPEHDLHTGLSRLLSRIELENFRARIDSMLQTRVFPSPGAGRPYPWPLV
jgi:uncharacterized repeat protein (TIGR03843 family)